MEIVLRSMAQIKLLCLFVTHFVHLQKCENCMTLHVKHLKYCLALGHTQYMLAVDV